MLTFFLQQYREMDKDWCKYLYLHTILRFDFSPRLFDNRNRRVLCAAKASQNREISLHHRLKNRSQSHGLTTCSQTQVSTVFSQTRHEPIRAMTMTDEMNFLECILKVLLNGFNSFLT